MYHNRNFYIVSNRLSEFSRTEVWLNLFLKQYLFSEQSKQSESCNTQGRDIQNLQLKNKTLLNELNDVKVQLEVKVHSLKEKLVDNENLTDKLKKTYECQIENLNVMINKLTSYLKDKTVELETVRKEKDRLQQIIDENNKGKVELALKHQVTALELTPRFFDGLLLGYSQRTNVRDVNKLL